MSLEGPILIAEDDKKTAALVELYLKREGFRTVIAYDGEQALEMARRHNPGFVILDLMLPLLDGWEVCRRLRQDSDVPILMLTARGEEVDRVSGLTLGADDYMVKPFSPRELVARVRAILRRGRQTATMGKGTLSHGDLLLDLGKRTASLRGRPLTLTPHEYRLLQAFMEAPGKIFTRQELLDHIYPGGEAVIERVIDVHIGKLRHKIEEDPAAPRRILTVRGIGYQLDEGGDS